MAEYVTGAVSVQSSTLNARQTRAAVAKYGVALERAVKENAPINKNPSRPSKGGRARLQVTVKGGGQDEDISVTISGPDYFKYVMAGTSPHTIKPRTAKVLAFPWNVAARITGVPGGLRRASRMPIFGYAGKAGDLRSLVRRSDLLKTSTQAFFSSVNHPGSSANDFIPPAIAQTGPELAQLEDAIGQDAADQIIAGLRSTFNASIR